MDKDLPDLYSGHTNGKSGSDRKPLLLKAADALKDGGGFEVGDTKFNLNRKRAAILTQVGDAMVEMAVNRHMEARAKARVPFLGGDLEVEANRDPEGRHRFEAKSSTPLFGGKLDIGAGRDADGNNRASIQFSKQFSSAKP